MFGYKVEIGVIQFIMGILDYVAADILKVNLKSFLSKRMRFKMGFWWSKLTAEIFKFCVYFKYLNIQKLK